MLAKNSFLKLTLTATGAFLMMVSVAFCQQTPSQIYQPVRDGIYQAPPSVHVPPTNTNRITNQVRPRFKLPNIDATNVNGQAAFTPNTAPPMQRGKPTQTQRPGYVLPPDAGVARASFEEASNEPSVPTILLGNTTKEATPQKTPDQFEVPEQTEFTEYRQEDVKTPADFEAAMTQVRSPLPRIAPSELAAEQERMATQVAELRRQIEQRTATEKKAADEAAALTAQVEAERLEQARLAKKLEEQKMIAAQRLADAKAKVEAEKAEAERLATERAEVERLAAERAAAEQAAAEKAAQAEKEMSASEFVSQISSEQQEAETSTATSAPKLTAKQGQSVPAVMQLARAEETFVQQPTIEEPVRDEQVVPVSAEDDVVKPAITLSAPALQVETFGPSTIGINKPATYQVVVRNNSSSKAERILVGINMPEWVEIKNINMTSGDKEITDGKDQARLVWTVDQVQASSTQTISITAIPRQAQVFDVGVEWTLVPRVGKSNIVVTEPKLDMNIAGPKEVRYGETALYHVTVSNPGTGTAENVVVMLPEALGGERATLGDINAGKEKNFQVELLARTAGDLNLVATAAADGNLKTSADQGLIVRRAHLDISIEGPGLKYAGSVAQYNISITNSGDTVATDVVSAVALPTGVKYLSGIDSVKLVEDGMRWTVGALEPGQTRDYRINCQLDTSGDLQLEVGARGAGELAAASACLTTVETVADLVLTVADPKGPLPTGQEVPYEIKVRNRGTKAAKGVNLVMQFSDGIEPRAATGLTNKLVPGQVFFNPIEKIDPGEELTLEVTAEALKSGTHVFRAQLTCQDSDAREVAEGTTRFFGDTIESTTTDTASSANEAGDFGGEFKR